jgi:hypothetical protein
LGLGVPLYADRRERRGLGELDLPRLPELEQGEEGDGLLDARQLLHLRVEVEAGSARQ